MSYQGRASLVLQAHPLMGMWAGDFGGHTGIQILTLSYDFSQRFAVIKASKARSDFALACKFFHE